MDRQGAGESYGSLERERGGGGASGRREMQKKDGAKTILNHAGYIVSNHVNYCGSYLNV